MTILAAILLIAVGSYALMQGCRGDWMFRQMWRCIALFCGLLVLLLIAGCDSTPDRPEPPPTPIVCAAPAGMTAQQTEPDRPQGEYTQGDVALYVTDLHRWGSQGWERLSAVRRHAANCIDNHTSDEPRK